MPQASPPQSNDPAKSSQWVFLLLPTALALLAFLPSLRNGFVWDDHFIVVPVEAYRNFDLGKIFSGPANGLEYLPIRDLTLALDMQIWGENPFGFHLTNLLLYALSLPLIHFATLELTRACGETRERIIALFTTTIFALHPLHAEPVNFITGRNNILAMLFATAALWLCLRGLRGSPRLAWLALLPFGLALLSKASVVFLPLFLAAAIALLPTLRQRPKHTWLILLAFLLLDAFAITGHLATAYRAKVLNPDVLVFGNTSVQWGIVKAIQIPFFYLEKFLIPFPLTVYYPNHFLAGHYLLRTALYALALLSAGLLLWRGARRAIYLPFLAFLWYLLALGPVSNLIPNEPVVADRYAYPAIFGLGLFAAWAIAQVPQRAWRAALVLALCVTWGGIDITRSFDWRTDLDLWASAYAAYPEQASIHYAQALDDAGEIHRGIEVLKKSKPDHFYLPLLQGKSALASGEIKRAIERLEASKRRGGEHNKDVRLALAQAYERSGQFRNALGEYLSIPMAASADPDGSKERAAERGVARLRDTLHPQRDRLKARAEANPQNPKALSDFAGFLFDSGEYDESIRYYRRAVDLAPRPWALWYNLGLAYTKAQRYARAREAYEEALERNPGAATILNDLGAVCALAQENENAVDYYRRAVAADPNDPNPAFNLGRLYLRLARNQQAREMLSIARERARSDPALATQIDYVLRRIP